MEELELFQIKIAGPMERAGPLYVRAEQGAFDSSTGALRKGEALSLDTYFNSFSCSKYLRWTRVSQAAAELNLSGPFQVELYACRKGKHSLASRQKAEGAVRIPFDFSKEEEDARYWLRLTAAGEGCRFLGGRFTCRAEPDRVRVALVICTYRREEYVLRNLEILSRQLLSSASLVKEEIAIFVVDNGQTLTGRFPQGKRLHLFPNKNLGGSGGFTRGLLEAMARREEFTHVLLMDDDVIIEPNALEKTIQFLKLLRPEYADLHIAGGMLDIDRPAVQHEATARWGKGVVHPLKSGLDLSEAASLSQNEREEPSDYAGWWYLCMPLSLVKPDNLPLPLFIKCDDAEYGLRNIRRLTAINGVGVWHKGFSAKYSPWLDYYVNRNIMVVDAIHSPAGSRMNIRFVLLKKMMSYLALGIPEASVFIQEAVRDYLKGPDFFLKVDQEAKNKELRTLCPQANQVQELPMRQKLLRLLGKAFTPSFWRVFGEYRRLSAEYQAGHKQAEALYQHRWRQLASQEEWERMLGRSN